MKSLKWMIAYGSMLSGTLALSNYSSGTKCDPPAEKTVVITITDERETDPMRTIGLQASPFN